MNRETTQVTFSIFLDSADYAEPEPTTRVDTAMLCDSLSYSINAETGIPYVPTPYVRPMTQEGRLWRTVAIAQAIALVTIFLTILIRNVS